METTANRSATTLETVTIVVPAMFDKGPIFAVVTGIVGLVCRRIGDFASKRA